MKKTYQTVTVQAHWTDGHSPKDDSLDAYGFGLTRLTNNLHNKAVFVQRQVITALSKDPARWTENEKEIMTRIEEALPAMGPKYHMPTEGHVILSHEFLNAYFYCTEDVDYFHPALPRQAAQQTLKEVNRIFVSYYNALAEYAREPEKFTGEPKFPGYQISGGCHTAILTNQDTVLRFDEDGNAWVKLPKVRRIFGYTKEQYETQRAFQEQKAKAEAIGQPEENTEETPRRRKRGDPAVAPNWTKDVPSRQRVLLGKCVPAVKGTRLKQVTVKPYQGKFFFQFNLEVPIPDEKENLSNKNENHTGAEEEITHDGERVACIDIGVNNLAAMTNNFGAMSVLLKGEIVKSVNQYYNRRMAEIKSEATKGTTEKFKPTPESQRLSLWRYNRIHDFMHKSARFVIDWCRKNRVDTLVVGNNKGWKQNVDMGPVQNQKFVYIPHAKFRNILEDLAGRHGIRFVTVEESYTSQASFLDNDPMPVYPKTPEKDFSGNRGPTWYGKKYRKNGFHGLYKASDDRIINADLNGSANIGRKYREDLFSSAIAPDFEHVLVIHHPDELHVNRKEMQARQKAAHTGPSKSKIRRDRRRAANAARAAKAAHSVA